MATRKEIKGVIIPRHDTAINWSKAVNFTPENGELIVISADDTADVARGYYLDTQGNKLTTVTVNSNGINTACAVEPSDKVRFKFGNGKDNVNALPFATTEVDLTDYATQDWVENYIAENVETGGSGGTILVEQTYNSESQNAQSGMAVAEAIETTVGRKTAEGGEIFNQYEDYKDTDTGIMYKKNTATGYSSTARGSGNEASGENADTSGRNNKATGARASAKGFSNIASGNDSTAGGHNTEASGWASDSNGRDTEASGDQATSRGRKTVAAGNQSTSEGWETRALGTASKAQGMRTIAQANNGAFAHGGYGGAYNYQTESGGYGCLAVGGNSSSKGHTTLALGYTTNTHGRETIAGMSGWGVERIVRGSEPNTLELYLYDGQPNNEIAPEDCLKPGTVDNKGEQFYDISAFDGKKSVDSFYEGIKNGTITELPVLFYKGESIPIKSYKVNDSGNVCDYSVIPAESTKATYDIDTNTFTIDNSSNNFTMSYCMPFTIKELCPTLSVGDTATFSCKCDSYLLIYFADVINFEGFSDRTSSCSFKVTKSILEAKIGFEIFNNHVDNVFITDLKIEKICDKHLLVEIDDISKISEEDLYDLSSELVVLKSDNAEHTVLPNKTNLLALEGVTLENIGMANLLETDLAYDSGIKGIIDGTLSKGAQWQLPSAYKSDGTNKNTYIQSTFELADFTNLGELRLDWTDGYESRWYEIFVSCSKDTLYDKPLYEYKNLEVGNLEQIFSLYLNIVKYIGIRFYHLQRGTVIKPAEFTLTKQVTKSTFSIDDTWLGNTLTHGYPLRPCVGANTNGYKTEARGQGSNANGVGTKAISKGQTALGTYNKEDVNAVAIFGNGTDEDHRSNAFTINKDGTASVQKSGTHDNNVVTYEQLNRLDSTTHTALHQITSELADVSNTVDSVASNLEVLEDAVDTTNLELTNLIGCGTKEPTSDMPYLFYVKYE